MSAAKPRIGFLGVGWIGRHRMEGIIETGAVEVVAVADPSPEMTEEAAKLVPGAAVGTTLEDVLAQDLDGLVIATPSALHADQSIAALKAGVAVFCQKPLGRSAREVQAVIDAAREADRLLGVDFSYRFTAGVQAIRELVQGGQLGDIRAIDLTFHNAYGPGKPWFYDRNLSGGGCLIDLGVHLIDLALWVLDFPEVSDVSGHLLSDGKLLEANPEAVEDYAVASFRLGSGTIVRIACSWQLHAGQEAVISAAFYGAGGGAELRNVNGSFYDFTAKRFRGTSSETLVSPPDEWGVRAAQDWAQRLAVSKRFDPQAERIVDVSRVLDRIYGIA
ncbi:Gfo/Idh/MocA family oxidoreductase [Tianweitania sp. BSSL-BM11]|uniref:Gfo/Idh/MocA family oxidoreductase n=1 Tax=Tianweitania aestuarii TaxID=2814886 RepID=A0ABS5RXX9_9HYPH|nr:Gfo/Idh/MocA family oxidoreductase [Tianweitania aestuarii]MBS9721879.1 Gfo/Idh/MocA family oxidoreductase [Tianweitania aestuarii]